VDHATFAACERKLPHVAQVSKPIRVQALILQLAVETFHVPVPLRLSRLDMHKFDLLLTDHARKCRLMNSGSLPFAAAAALNIHPGERASVTTAGSLREMHVLGGVKSVSKTQMGANLQCAACTPSTLVSRVGPELRSMVMARMPRRRS
jgi:hypothetical protein